MICLGANLSLGVAQTDGGCDSGSLQCCNSVTSTDPNGTLPPDDGPFGVNCKQTYFIILHSCYWTLILHHFKYRLANFGYRTWW